MSEDMIEVVFENEEATGGGYVESVDLDRASGVAVITFEDSQG